MAVQIEVLLAGEAAAIAQALTNRCMQLAAEVAHLRASNEELQGALKTVTESVTKQSASNAEAAARQRGNGHDDASQSHPI